MKRKLRDTGIGILLVFAQTLQAGTVPTHKSPGERSRTIDSLEQAYRTAANDTSRMMCLARIATAFSILSQSDSAIFYSEKLMTTAQALIDRDPSKELRSFSVGRIGAGARTIAMVYVNRGDYPSALKILFNALGIADRENNLWVKADCYSIMCLAYKGQNDTAQAIRYGELSLSIREKLGDKRGLSVANNNLGTIYLKMERYNDALRYFEKAMQLYTETGNKRGMAGSYSNIAAVWSHNNSYVKALEYYSKAERIMKELDDKVGIATVLVNKGTALVNTGKLKEAADVYTEVMEISEKAHIMPCLAEAHHGMFEVDSLRNDFKNALFHYKLYIAWNDSLVNEENTKKTAQAQMQYEFDKKQAEAKADQEKKDALAAADARKQKIILWSVVGGLLLVIGFAVFIYRSYREKQKANVEISLQKQIIEEKQKEILDSIHYARRIQRSLMPGEKYIQRKLEKK